MIALIFTLYILTFYMDLLPTTRRHRFKPDSAGENGHADGHGPTEVEMGYAPDAQ